MSDTVLTNLTDEDVDTTADTSLDDPSVSCCPAPEPGIEDPGTGGSEGDLTTTVTMLPSATAMPVTDQNGNAVPGLLLVDLDGDGWFEAQVSRLDDGYLVAVDTDGDGVLDAHTELTRDQLVTAPELATFLDAEFGAIDESADPAVDPTWSVEDGVLVGDPTGAAEHWFEQAQNGFCVPASVAQIVSDYTGVHFADESQFVALANELGVLTIGPDGVPGMTAEGALTLLEAAGVPASLETQAEVGTLVEYLDAGHNVMLFMDSGEYWYGEDIEDNRMDHAVVLTGIDLERGVAILSDPGTPDGNSLEVPLDVFTDAWADSGNTLLVSDQPAPDDAAPTGTAAALAGGDDARDGIAHAVDWLVDRPWVLLPVVLGAASVVAARR